MDIAMKAPTETSAQVTITELLGWVTEEQRAIERATDEVLRATTARFETIVNGLANYEPSVAFGLLSDAVAETKPKDDDGKPYKGAKADPVVAVRMSELRQIIGAIQGGWDQWPEMIKRGRDAAVTEAREWLKGVRPVRQEDGSIKRELVAEPMTAKGEPVAVVKRRQQARKLGRAMRELIEDPDEGVELADEQVEKVEAGMPLALVLTEDQRKQIAEKARNKVAQEAVAKAIEKWQSRADKFVDEVMADGLGEDAILAMFGRMKVRALAVMRGEPAPM